MRKKGEKNFREKLSKPQGGEFAARIGASPFHEKRTLTEERTAAVKNLRAWDRGITLPVTQNVY